MAIVSNTQNSPASNGPTHTPNVGQGNPYAEPGIPGLYSGTNNKSLQAPKN